MLAKKTRLLIVDDEPDAVNSLKRFLSERDFEIFTAYSGEEALGIMMLQKIDSILLDVMLPGMKGDELTRILRDKYPRTKIFIVTAYPEEGVRIILKNDIVGFLLKPCNVHDIYSHLASMRNM